MPSLPIEWLSGGDSDGTHRYGRGVCAAEQILLWSIVRCNCYWPAPYLVCSAHVIASGIPTGRASRERSVLRHISIISEIGEHYRTDLHLANMTVSGDIGQHHI